MRRVSTCEISTLACSAHAVSIEAKAQRIDEIGVKIVGSKDNFSDAEQALRKDKEFLAERVKTTLFVSKVDRCILEMHVERCSGR